VCDNHILNPLEQIAHLTHGQKNYAVHRLRPDESTSVETLGIQRQTDPIMPNRLDERTTASAEEEDVAGERIPAKTFLDL